jgi:hypothetical protein
MTLNTIFDIETFRAHAETQAESYARATPFAHAILDGMLKVDPKELLESFPSPQWPHWQALGDTYQLKKFSCNDIARIPPLLAQIITEMSTPAFLRALEKMTGIARLLPDPYLTGGGLHMSCPGGVLAPHTDFHIYGALDLYRRINVIVYLNEDWQESFGGCLELGEDDDKKVIVPRFGRCVIFTTDDKSVHGFPKPVAEDHWRKSIALYYYTAKEATNFSGDTTTYWRRHGEQPGVQRKLRLAIFKLLMKASRLFSILAHLSNPNQGMGGWKAYRKNLKEDDAP